MSYEGNFEYQPIEQEELESLARIFMIKEYWKKENLLTSGEELRLSIFLSNANQDDMEKVKKLATKNAKYFKYIDKKTTEEERGKIEDEMESDPDLKAHIEGSQAWALTEKYSIWKYGVQEQAKDPEGKIFEMDDDEIFAFFDLLERYPEVVDEALRSMNSGIRLAQDETFEMKPNEKMFLSEREMLMNLKEFFKGDKNKINQDFYNEIIENPSFQSMFIKIQNALR